MNASLAADLLGAVAVLLLLGLGAACVGALLVGRALHRRWRLLRSHGAVVALVALWDVASAIRARRRPTPVAEESFWTSPRSVRRAVRRAVDGATSAVRTAEGLGAPVAELPALCRRLDAASADLDRVLRIDGVGPVPSSLRGQVVRVLQASDDVRRAAMTAAGDACDPRLTELARDAGDEVQLLDAGLASARATLTRP